MHLRSDPQIALESFYGIYSCAPEMREFFRLLTRVAKSDASVLLRGESGTGKELAAAAIHRLSPRYRGPFQAINCATLTPELAASELFGHVKGAFTGAVAPRKGLFELADSGTIFLDEVAELSLEVQARLLRVLQERTIVPVGATASQRIDVRILTATHVSLREAVEERRFREDLMYRIRVVPLFLPPLVERQGDLEALTWRFIGEWNQRGDRQVTSLTQEAWDAMSSYPWPGNVRELHNAIEHAFVLGEGDTISLQDLPPELRGSAPVHRLGERAQLPAASSCPPARTQSDDDERQRIIDALESAGGAKSTAAEQLGISRTTLWRKMREHQLLR